MLNYCHPMSIRANYLVKEKWSTVCPPLFPHTKTIKGRDFRCSRSPIEHLLSFEIASHLTGYIHRFVTQATCQFIVLSYHIIHFLSTDTMFSKLLCSLTILSATLSGVRAQEPIVFNVANKPLDPDGFNRSTVVVNGQFPGPLITANKGDTVFVRISLPSPTLLETSHVHKS